ncbi:type IV-A pilus assembly ATPase PilB [Methylophilus sp. Q8]|uniref:type IV-A pilus assembly ATPase PilB n=1 Tax=Methylophilus sp. Q8 TaxID=1506586 RepID=UPI000648BA22|nr:type IV-A pilus assembly ATPase PilB [Methylophilus sp. Q8]
MATLESSRKLGGMARMLVQSSLMNEDDAAALQEKSSAQKVSFLAATLAQKKISAKDIAQTASNAFGFPFLDLDALDQDSLPDKTIDIKLMQSHRVLLLQQKSNVAYIAISDPTNLHSLDTIQFQMGATLFPIVVEDDKLGKWIDKIVDSKDTSMSNLNAGSDDFDLGMEEAGEEQEAEVIQEVDDAPVVKFLQKILLDAINMGASDLHFEPYEKFYRIRFRVDGVLRDMSQPPLAIKEKLASRIKVISNLDISEKRVPQDGRMKLIITKTRAIDFRVSTLPLIHGEKIVMRILDPTSATLGIEALGYEAEQQASLLKAIHRPYGLVLVTGPTGSGKTVSLYTCLNLLNDPGVNISTAEDPAEIPLAGINQVNVNDKQGLTFAAALKSFLRQDPDIIMIGEIRDLETADMAIKAASTGHMVLSTLHTNDAPTTLSRLLNMGVAPFNIASAVTLITAQRLARRLCKHCKVPLNVPQEALLKVGFTAAMLEGDWQLYGAKEGGCEHCNNGYKGRVGIYQVMPITEAMAQIIMSNGNALDIAAQAKKDGVKDLRESGLLKVKQGLTSIEEVEAVTNE